MLHTFEEVNLRATKTGKCRCGKRRTRATTVCQTLSPFNKNEDGTLKNRYEIMEELRVELTKWREEPITCDNCPK